MLITIETENQDKKQKVIKFLRDNFWDLEVINYKDKLVCYTGEIKPQ